MTVTLDNMTTLLHIPRIGQLCTNAVLDFEATLETLIDLLGVDRTRTTSKLRQHCGPQVRLSWMRDLYNEYYEN